MLLNVISCIINSFRNVVTGVYNCVNILYNICFNIMENLCVPTCKQLYPFSGIVPSSAHISGNNFFLTINNKEIH